MSRRCAFLDRDGTLNPNPPDHQYLTRAEDFAWLPGAIDGLRTLSAAGFLLAVVSNQRGVARGLVDPSVLRQIEARMQSDLTPHGAQFAAFRYCPHDLAAQCDCRKPAPGMILSLARDLQVDLARSWMIGDTESDVAAGAAAGCLTALVSGAVVLPQSASPDLTTPTIREAARKIVRWSESQPEEGAKPATRDS